MRIVCARGLLALAGVMAATAAQAELKYRIQDLGTLQGGTEWLDAFAINNNGAIVGQSINTDRNTRYAAFIWENGSMRGLAPYGQWANYYEAVDINDGGVAVGTFREQKTRDTRPMLYRNGEVIDISVEPGPGSRGSALAINNSGVAVGYFNRRAFIYDGNSSQYIPLGHPTQFVSAYAINDHGLVLGTAAGGRNSYNFLWDGENVTRLPSYGELTGFTPVDLNNAGVVVGRMSAVGPGAPWTHQAFIYSDGKFQALGEWSNQSEELLPSAINDKGWVVGVGLQSNDGDTEVNAFLWRNGESMHLNDLAVPDASGAMWDLRYARDVNERGQIVGLFSESRPDN